MITSSRLSVFLVDDETLALERLSRMLKDTGRVEIVGAASDPEAALEQLAETQVDSLFLDIHMPGLSGFDLLERLAWQPFVVFTTAHDDYALQAFKVHSIDYLLKPVEPDQLDRALNKLERLVAGRNGSVPPDYRSIFARLTAAVEKRSRSYPTRIATRSGDRVRFIEFAQISHFFVRDKVTFAATANGNQIVDRSLAELDQELDPSTFVRIHRAIVLNLDYIEEIHSWFGARLLIRLKDGKHTELTVARDRVRALKERLSF